MKYSETDTSGPHKLGLHNIDIIIIDITSINYYITIMTILCKYLEKNNEFLFPNFNKNDST